MATYKFLSKSKHIENLSFHTNEQKSRVFQDPLNDRVVGTNSVCRLFHFFFMNQKFDTIKIPKSVEEKPP